MSHTRLSYTAYIWGLAVTAPLNKPLAFVADIQSPIFWSHTVHYADRHPFVPSLDQLPSLVVRLYSNTPDGRSSTSV